MEREAFTDWGSGEARTDRETHLPRGGVGLPCILEDISERRARGKTEGGWKLIPSHLLPLPQGPPTPVLSHRHSLVVTETAGTNPPLPLSHPLEYSEPGASLVVHCLRLHVLPMQGAWVRSLVGELRSHTVRGVFRKVKWNEIELRRGHFCRVRRGGRGWGDLCLLFL